MANSVHLQLGCHAQQRLHLSSKDGKGEDNLEQLVEAAAQLRRRHLTAVAGTVVREVYSTL